MGLWVLVVIDGKACVSQFLSKAKDQIPDLDKVCRHVPLCCLLYVIHWSDPAQTLSTLG